MEIVASRTAQVGGAEVRRALPQRERRTIGSWCFLDHFGPTEPGDGYRMAVGPHPHIGLATVTWLIDGEALHTDSLGSEQTIRPGQLNLMTAGNGIAHAEETPIGRAGRMHGVQFWVALPESTRHGAAAFEHRAELPVLDIGPARVTVLMGSLEGESAPTRTDWPTIGTDIVMTAGVVTIPLDPGFEHGVMVLSGTLEVLDGAEATEVAGPIVPTDSIVHVAPGRDQLTLRASGPTRAMLIGGPPFEAPIHMWWNFVGRERAEIEVASDDWNAGSDRFGPVESGLARIPAPPVPWRNP